MRVRSILNSGGAECILGALFFLVAFLDYLTGGTALGWTPWWDALVLALLCLGMRWPLVSAWALFVAVPLGMLVDPLGQGMYVLISSCAVVLMIRRDHLRLAVIGTVVFGGVNYAVLFVRAAYFGDPPAPFFMLASVGIWYAVVWAIGLGIRGLARAEAARVASQYRERQLSIAADLHDFVARNLSALVMAAEALPETDDPGAASKVAERARLANATLRDITEVMRGGPRRLRPAVGAEEALRQAEEMFAAQKGAVSVEGETAASLHELPEELDLVAGRIIAEALHNALAHGDVREPCVLVAERSEETLDIVVSNRIARRTSSSALPTMGVMAMVQHAEMLGGRVESTALGDMWVCTATLPLDGIGDRT
ncbi:MAG: hypothetical protein IPJ61_17305 [Tessaracoccus sp.]|uniref:sensor histidine kinase n=1 Tax=Tessaracoccus sp. TaxID=1971211 RepID=UPI001EC318C2|nr:histidine kinase [Tessaracoccus sp.]MBK7822768.1 hypothetical protein [Tessaracoccus sp.]